MVSSEKIRNLLLTVIASVAGAAAIGVWTFYRDWTIDEAIEESTQFDSPEQKVRVIDHSDKVPTEAVREFMVRQEAVNREVLDDLHKVLDKIQEQDSINKRTHDQIYQTNQLLKQADQ